MLCLSVGYVSLTLRGESSFFACEREKAVSLVRVLETWGLHHGPDSDKIATNLNPINFVGFGTHQLKS